MDAAQLWVEINGGLIIARIRGVPTEELLRECQSRVLQLVQDTGRDGFCMTRWNWNCRPLSRRSSSRSLSRSSGRRCDCGERLSCQIRG